VDFPCYAAIQHHATVVEKVLRAAKASAGHVAIVTLAERPWVFESSDKYLPGLDMAELLKELQIPVYYAPEHAKKDKEGSEDIQDARVGMKQGAMSEFLQVKFGGHAVESNAFLNVTSIGDSMVEKEAVEATVRVAELGREEPCLCKTVKLVGDPSLKQLTDQLEILSASLETVAGHPCDLDIHVQSPEDLTSQLSALS